MSFDQLPLDIVKYIVLPLPYECLCNFLCVSRLTISVASDANFWKSKIELDHKTTNFINNKYKAYYELLLSQEMDQYTLDLFNNEVVDNKKLWIEQELRQLSKQYSFSEHTVLMELEKEWRQNLILTARQNHLRASKLLKRARQQLTITYQVDYIKIDNVKTDLINKIVLLALIRGTDRPDFLPNAILAFKLDQFFKDNYILYNKKPINLNPGQLIKLVAIDSLYFILLYVFTHDNRLYVDFRTHNSVITLIDLPEMLVEHFTVNKQVNISQLVKTYPQLLEFI